MAASITVIIPTYKRPDFLRRAIDSVLIQTQVPDEILVCEDGQSEETKQIVLDYENNKIVWLPGSHAGHPSVPRNRGIRAASGTLLAFLDDDDAWDPEKLEKQYANIVETGCLAACTNAVRVRGQHKETLYFSRPLPPKLHFSDLVRTNYIICSSVLIEKELVKSVGGFPEDKSLIGVEDFALWLRIAQFSDWAYLSEPLTVYNDDPAHSIRRKSPDQKEQKQVIYKNFLRWSMSNSLFLRYWATVAFLLFINGVRRKFA